eukprot:GILJ01002947.1.p1 GENE.GILJ01002947.1~~GILJ01002947.1.p1  ORF type:complete len:839 (+),score=116.64 GILJ01002947.1:55-2571(+)
MRLTPREVDHLVLHQAGFLAQKRLARGLRLNQVEATALIASQCLEFIRDGRRVAELMDVGRRLLGKRQVMPGVPSLIHEVQVEGTFPDGCKLVTVHTPIVLEDGDLTLALYGSFLPVPDLKSFEEPKDSIVASNLPGEILVAAGDIVLNQGRETVRLSVTNMGDRPIQVGSHYHFIESNSLLRFDRMLAYGKRLHIAAGTAVRFEPGDTKTVTLVNIGGKRIIRGGNGVANGPVDPARLPAILSDLQSRGFAHQEQAIEQVSKKQKTESSTLSRQHYVDIYGPTTGDRIMLGDTGLIAQIEKDFTVYGDECVFGGGKVLREGMGQATGVRDAEALDVVITNATIIDYTGIYKADIGLKNGFICAIGKAGNPDVMDGVSENMIVGVTTEVIAGEGKIVTAGGMDAHIHYICPQQAFEAIASGVTTMLGGGTGPTTGTCATTCTPSVNHVRMMLQSTDVLPLNIALTGKGNTSDPAGLADVVEAGCVGLKLHEDWGTTPMAIDCCLSVAEKYDIQVTIHTDTLNESCVVEQSVAAFKGRTIHTYHSEGAGGGHAPDIITVCGEPNVIPSSTNPTRPFTVNTIDEHVDMLMVCHHLDKNIPEDVAFAESRIRGETIQSEDILHDLGAISIMSSDSQAMGRVGEVVTRTWQTAAKMKRQRGPLPEDNETNDNFRIRRYIAKYTVNPAIAHGMSHIIGSVEVGKFADLVLWTPAFFGAKPEMILKGGMIAWAQMGDPGASIPTPEPVQMRPMFGSFGGAVGACSIAFVSQAAMANQVKEKYGLCKRVEAVRGCRQVTKADMKLNSTLPQIKVDPETYLVTADGQELKCEPARELPLAQRYFLF